LPIGEFDNYYLLCLDTQSEKIVSIDVDDYYTCNSKEDFEENITNIFDHFDQLLECFFLKKTHECNKS